MSIRDKLLSRFPRLQSAYLKMNETRETESEPIPIFMSVIAVTSETAEHTAVLHDRASEMFGRVSEIKMRTVLGKNFYGFVFLVFTEHLIRMRQFEQLNRQSCIDYDLSVIPANTAEQQDRIHTIFCSLMEVN